MVLNIYNTVLTYNTEKSGIITGKAAILEHIERLWTQPKKHSNFIIAISKSIFITQISILYHYKGLETYTLNILK